MSTTNEVTPQPKKGRGRPSKNSSTNNSNGINVTVKSNQKQKASQTNNSTSNNIINNINNNDEPSVVSTSQNTKRKSIMDSLLDQESEQTISSELQNLAIEQFGQDVFQKAFEMSRGSLSMFCAYMNNFRIFKLQKPNHPIPANWYIDDYWMYSPDERVDMLNAAFEIQDDDADLKSTVEGEFKCSACKSRKIRLRLRQIRSSDEPMSQFFKCADCKKEWVIH
jgi:DNA-directed RNA polymerase subunit M/transcription elongation factor TFIIS